jgi:hypothetical protein
MVLPTLINPYNDIELPHRTKFLNESELPSAR